MARIRSRNTEPEKLLRSTLWKRGLRYRIHYRTPAGRPDLVFPARNLAVFVDGCFWHGCPDHYVRPRSSGDFWAGKLRENVRRDQRQTRELEGAGWAVLRFWEHEVFSDVSAVASCVEECLSAERGATELEPRVVRVEALPGGDRERRWLVDLRNDDWGELVEQVRHTRKW